jgi:hypothetical protein
VYADDSDGLGGQTDFSLDGASAFTIRFTGVQLNWKHSAYGKLFFLAGPDGRNVMIEGVGSTGGINVRLVPDMSSLATSTIPWPSEYSEGLPSDRPLDLTYVLNGTSGISTLYIDAVAVANTKSPTTSGGYVLPTHEFSSGYKFATSNRNGVMTARAIRGQHEALTVWSGVDLSPETILEMHQGVYRNVPTPSHHYSFCEGATTTDASDGAFPVDGMSVTDAVISDHVTSDPSHALVFRGKFRKNRDYPAASPMTPCCEEVHLKRGFVTRPVTGAFRKTVDALDQERVEEGKRCHASRE